MTEKDDKWPKNIFYTAWKLRRQYDSRGVN